MLDRVIPRSKTEREPSLYPSYPPKSLRWRTVAPIQVGELLPYINRSISCVYREIGEAGVQHYTSEATLSLPLADVLDAYLTLSSRMTGMKDFLS